MQTNNIPILQRIELPGVDRICLLTINGIKVQKILIKNLIKHMKKFPMEKKTTLGASNLFFCSFFFKSQADSQDLSKFCFSLISTDDKITLV